MSNTSTIYVCGICGHIEFNQVPDLCPVCFAPGEKIIQDDLAIHPAEKEGREKHVPVITLQDQCGLLPGICRDVQIKIGSLPHPMESDHMIEWIDVYLNGAVLARYQMYSIFLQAAVAIHLKNGQQGTLTVVEHCNKHGYWMAEAAL